MSNKGKVWIGALRLRTLPLAAGGIILGSFLPEVYPNHFSWTVFVLALLTAFGLQITSNLANDYGDFVKGTDNEKRVGPERALQSGMIQPAEMKRALIFSVASTFLLGNLLLFLSFGTENYLSALLMLAVGIAGIWAAIKYTVGAGAYGYSGFGDLFVLVFFGLVSVVGASFLYLGELSPHMIWPALSYGFLSVGVLNINNMRDIDNDRNSNKHTLVVKMGAQSARVYHGFLILGAMVSMAVYFYSSELSASSDSVFKYIWMLSFIPVLINTAGVLKKKAHASEYNAYLKGLSLGTLAQVIIYVILIQSLA
ncbi:MAG: 1,4-dihydroxy-2-naphthoate octaprenyltransferase [Bacteroidetes bacterium]|nr:MAG: 1,4-dihydroxy-2-naphthoate octaprenyltransferase [Bacteroidota bacterium]